MCARTPVSSRAGSSCGTRIVVVLSAMVLVTSVGLVSPAEAQIYSWHDSRGILILSDRPHPQGAPSFPITATSTVRTTKSTASSSQSRYDGLIEGQAARYQVRPDLVRAVIQVESGFNPRARSRKGAMGLMQLMPATAAALGVHDPYDPAENIRGGVAYLRQLLDRYDQREELALAAYNAGPTAVDRYGSSVPPYRETRNYVSRIKDITSVSTPAAGRLTYKTIEIINGRPVPRYSDSKPSSGQYEIITVGR